MLFTAGSGDHFLDFRRVRCKAGTLVHARPGQVQQFVLGQKLEADILLFTSEFIFPAFPGADGASLERDMNTAIARHLERSSEKTTSSFDSMVSVAIFSRLGLLISLSVLLVDRYIPGDWF